MWFAYKEDDWVLKDVSFTVEPGQSIALVGHTGSGKTTITNLLMRFYDVRRGRILLDGVDLRDWDLEALRQNFAVVLQDVFLFSGTVESNIRLGRPDIDETRVHWAASEVHADRFIRRLPDGYKTEVRERGAGLSVGQKQLISFARALAFDPALLILDEATSSIDTETERLIQQAIERVMLGRTSLVVAHRLSTVQSRPHHRLTTARYASKARTRNYSPRAVSTGNSTNCIRRPRARRQSPGESEPLSGRVQYGD